MNKKKNEHDELSKIHIYTMWEKDLDNFEECLTKVEEMQEKKRLAEGVKNGNKGPQKRRPPPKKPKQQQMKSDDSADDFKPTAKPARKKPANENKKPEKEPKENKQVKIVKPAEDKPLTLRERMGMSKDLP